MTEVRSQRMKTLGHGSEMSVKSDQANSKKPDYLKEIRLKREAKEKKSLQNSSGTLGPISRNEIQLNRLTTNHKLSDI